jgi:hypothetical protein
MADSAGELMTAEGMASAAGAADSVATGALTAAGSAEAGANVASLVGPRTLTATATTLEVGLTHSAGGWVKVRAEVGGDGIAASLSASSHAGESLLRAQLPALNAFLASEQIHAHAAVLASAVTGASGTTGSAGTGSTGAAASEDATRSSHAGNAAMEFGTGTQHPGQNDGDAREQRSFTGPVEGADGTAATAAATLQNQELSHTRLDASVPQLLLSPASTITGGWLNVLA